MSGLGGLFELVMVFAIVLAWGFVELRSLRRDRAKADAAREVLPHGGVDAPDEGSPREVRPTGAAEHAER